jgi:carbamoylphosphate synthase small subunit
VGFFYSNHVWKSTQGEIANIATEYFQHMFTSSSPSEIAEVVQLVDKVVTPELNADLLLPFSPDEVKMALFQMHPSKAPGPDGMTALFFQKYWHIVGKDVINAVLDFLQ